MTPTQFNSLYNNQSIIREIEELILNSKTDATRGQGINLPNVSEQLSKLEVTHDNIPQMQQLRDKLSAVRETLRAKADADHKQTTALGDSELTGYRNVLTESHIESIKQFDESFKPFVTKIKTKIDEELKKPIPTLQETELRVLREMPTIHPINYHTLEVDFAFNDNKSNFGNNTVTNINSTVINNPNNTFTNINSTVIKDKVAKNTKNACCTIF